MPAAPARPPLSRAARLSLNLAIVSLVANLVFNGVSQALQGSGRSTVALGIAQLVVVAAVAVIAVVFAARGIRETSGGAHRGRGRAIAAIVIGGLVLLGTVVLTGVGLVLSV